MRRKRIPYSVVGGTSYFERKEIKDLAAYLKIIANPLDDLSLLRAANTPKRGLGPSAIRKLADFAQNNSITLLEAFMRAGEITGMGEKVSGSAIGFASLINRYSALFLKNKEMGKVFRSLTEEINYQDYIYELYKTPETAIRRVENLEGFIDSLSHYETDGESPSLHGFLETLALTDLLREKEEKISRGVTLISFHSSKGLEFPVVFIVGVEEDILPHKKSMDLDGAVEEERRLFYVGITRAMKELYITYTDHRIKYGKNAPATPSRFLDEIPDEVVKRLDSIEKTDPEQDEKDANNFFADIQAMLGS